MRRIRQGCCGRRCRPPQPPLASAPPAASSSLLLLAAALVLLAAAGRLPTAAARSPPLPPAAAPSAASFTHRVHLPSSFAGAAAGSSSAADHRASPAQPANPAAARGHHGRKWTTVLQQHDGVHDGPGSAAATAGAPESYFYPAPAPAPIPTGGVGLLAQLKHRQQRRQRDRVRELLLRAVGGGGQSTQVLERPTTAGAAAMLAEAPVSPEWFTTWVDADARGAATLLAPPAPLQGESPGPYEAFDFAESVAGLEEMEGERAREQEETDQFAFEYEGAALLMDSYLGPVVTRPTPSAATGVVAIRPPGAASVVVQRPPMSFAPATDAAASAAAVVGSPALQAHARRRQAGILARAVRGYTSLLERHYHLVSFVQATILGIIGDMIAQVIECVARGGGLGAPGGLLGLLARFRPNVVRTGNVAMLAAIIDGIVTPQYYDLMERVSPRKSLKVIALKLLVTLSVYGPLTNGAFLAAVPVLEKGLSAFNPAVWVQQLKEITVRDVQLWSFFYPVNFTLVPRALRPLANNIMATTFLVILSVCAYGSGGPGAL